MKRLIYDLFYAGKITKDVAIQLLDKWSTEEIKNNTNAN